VLRLYREASNGWTQAKANDANGGWQGRSNGWTIARDPGFVQNCAESHDRPRFQDRSIPLLRSSVIYLPKDGAAGCNNPAISYRAGFRAVHEDREVAYLLPVPDRYSPLITDVAGDKA